MSYKLLCTDIDGTLLNKDRELSSFTIQEMKRIKDSTPIILISSRMPAAMRHLQEELNITDLPLLCYNGGLILDQGTVIETTEISNTVLATAIELAKGTSVHLSLYHNDDWFVPAMDFWAKREENNTKVTPTVQDTTTTLHQWIEANKGAHKIMAMGDANDIGTFYTQLEEAHRDGVNLYRSKDTYIEIAAKSISKETAIASLLKYKYPAIEFKDIIAFGDNYNDMKMLKAVGMGVAVANAKEEVLAIADDVTDINKEDGVAKSIQKYFK